MVDLDKIGDEGFYDTAVQEIKAGQYSDALWSKALAKSDFDESVAKGNYVELRVEQLKAQHQLEQDAAEETRRINSEIKDKDAELEKLDDEIADAKIEVAFQMIEVKMMNALSNPLFIIQVLLLASAVGYFMHSWWLFGITFFGLAVMVAIPLLDHLVGIVLAGLFGYCAYLIGVEWWDVETGYWAGGITGLAVLGANLELLGQNRKVDEEVKKIGNQ